jgi:hypothetical protein
MSPSRHERSDGPRRCVVCGSKVYVEGNHLGGRNFLAWFTMPFCRECHNRFHILARQAGVELEYTDDPIENLRRALALIKIGEWMLLEQMKNELEKINEKQTK